MALNHIHLDTRSTVRWRGLTGEYTVSTVWTIHGAQKDLFKLRMFPKLLEKESWFGMAGKASSNEQTKKRKALF